MKTLTIKALSLFLFFSTLCIAQDTITDRSTKKSFPRSVSFEYLGKNYDLEATGVATRKKFFAKVYSVAHYMEKSDEEQRGNVFDDILNSDKAKQLTSIWVRDVGLNKVKSGYRESFQKSIGRGQIKEFDNEIDQFLSFFTSNVDTNDEHIFRWMPDGSIEVEINGEKKGEIKNERFARGLWGIWFGRSSVVNRNDLVSQIR